ncbi:MAG: ankyrin repeat domain-containing protein [Acidobacteriota bacterium]
MASWKSKILVFACASAFANDPDGTTPLHYAARNHDITAVRALLAKGEKADAENRYGVTPLLLVVEQGDVETMNALIAAGADVNHVLPEGETILMTAARTGNVAVLQALLKRDARVGTLDGFYGESALHWAVAENHAGAVRALMDAGADVNMRTAPAKFARRNAGLTRLSLGEWTPLMYAARDGVMDAAKVLIERKADVNLTDPDGTTALVLAIINYHYDFASMLLDHGADPNIADGTGMGALYAAVDMNTLPWMFGRPEIVAPSKVTGLQLIEKLLDKGAKPDTALTAVQTQRAHTDGDTSLNVGSTAFMRAAKAGDAPAMKLLLAHGANPTLAQKNGNNALMLAAGLGYRDGNMAVPTKDRGTTEEIIAAIDVCLQSGLDINAGGANGDTALHYAVSGRGDLDVIRYLVEHGASLTVKNTKGQTALEAAKTSRRDRTEAAKLLEQLAAR